MTSMAVILSRAPFTLQASTSEVYGDPELHPQPETYWGNVNPIGIRSCYDEGKRCAETLFNDYHHQNQVRIKIIRIFNTYGPRMRLNDGRALPTFMSQALRGEDITVFGNGLQTRAFCYVGDSVAEPLRYYHNNVAAPLVLLEAMLADARHQCEVEADRAEDDLRQFVGELTIGIAHVGHLDARLTGKGFCMSPSTNAAP